MCGFASAFIVYDCEDKKVNISVVSLLDVAPCPNAETDYTTRSVKIQVIQKNDIQIQKVTACMVEITRIVMHCGMHSHSSIVAGGLAEYIYPLGAVDCKEAHKYLTVKIYQHTIGMLQMNSTTTVSVTLRGHVSDDGSCEGITYSEDGHEWHKVVVTATIKIHLRQYFAKIKLETNESICLEE